MFRVGLLAGCRMRLDDRKRTKGTGSGWHVLVLAVAALLIALAYSNAIPNGFVYDDLLQIAGNPLIQHPQHLARALVSDVWAFQGDRGAAWSNYWRPTFVLWMRANFLLFQLRPPGWHFTNIALHMAVCCLAYFVLLEFGMRPAGCAAVTWLFAAHPVHVESVAWPSGAPDMLMALFLLGSFLAYLVARRRAGRAPWVASLLLYGFALLSKEGAAVFPVLVAVAEGIAPGGGLRAALRRAAPYLAVAALFVAVRYAVLGTMRVPNPGGPTATEAILTAPSILLFYVRQILWPVDLSPVYPLRPLAPSAAGFSSFVLPLFASLALAALAFAAARRDRDLAFGLSWFVLPLALSFDIRAFEREQIVHDRYLYVASLGALAFLVTAVGRLGERAPALRARAPRFVAVAALIVSLGFVPMVRAYNPVWKNNTTFWERAVESDPSSAVALSELADEYRRAGRIDEARGLLERAVAAKPDAINARIGLAVIAISDQRYVEAERLLRSVLEAYPDHTLALERLGVLYQKQQKYDEAIAVFERGRSLVPYKRGEYTLDIALLHQMASRDRNALSELESVRGELGTSTDRRVLVAWLFLGDLHRKLGNPGQAARDYRSLLGALSDATDEAAVKLRERANAGLREVEGRR
jgi:tetratricopeptide (TPR) repeat protein